MDIPQNILCMFMIKIPNRGIIECLPLSLIHVAPQPAFFQSHLVIEAPLKNVAITRGHRSNGLFIEPEKRLCSLDLAILYLDLDQLSIETTASEQLLMRALFHDTPLIQNQNQICVADCAQPVSNYY